jgi:hypothetical protein
MGLTSRCVRGLAGKKSQSLPHREANRGGRHGSRISRHDEQLERDVAIKVLPPGTLADEAARKRFRQEALSLAKLNHPNIATIHDFDTADETDFLVTEYIAGASLDKRLASGPLRSKEVIRLGLQFAQGLAAAHAQGIIHRDLKPANLQRGIFLLPSATAPERPPPSTQPRTSCTTRVTWAAPVNCTTRLRQSIGRSAARQESRRPRTTPRASLAIRATS